MDGAIIGLRFDSTQNSLIAPGPILAYARGATPLNTSRTVKSNVPDLIHQRMPQEPRVDGTGGPYRILAVTRKPESASFQQRIENYLTPLVANGVEVECRHFPKAQRKQLEVINQCGDFDGVWWHRHLLSPWWLPRLQRTAKRLVFDFDDPLPYSARGGGRISVTRRWRFGRLLMRCDAALTASRHLAEMAEVYCRNVVVVPMAIDLPATPPRLEERVGPLQLLWVGSRATEPYLDIIRPALAAVGDMDHEVRLRLVAHSPLEFSRLPVDFRPWSPEEQERGLRECHVGICPMPDTVWTRGKCPYKVIQYMAYGMPWIGSAVGENIRTASGPDESDVRGLCASTIGQWVEAFKRLIGDPDLRSRLGCHGRDYVEREHAREHLVNRLAAIWRDVIKAV